MGIIVWFISEEKQMSRVHLFFKGFFNRFEEILADQLEPYNITTVEFDALMSLYRPGNQTPTELANNIGIAPKSLTPVVDGLVEKGYAKKVPGQVKGTFRIYLTDKGENLYHTSLITITSIVEKEFSLSDEATSMYGYLKELLK